MFLSNGIALAIKLYVFVKKQIYVMHVIVYNIYRNSADFTTHF